MPTARAIKKAKKKSALKAVHKTEINPFAAPEKMDWSRIRVPRPKREYFAPTVHQRLNAMKLKKGAVGMARAILGRDDPLVKRLEQIPDDAFEKMYRDGNSGFFEEYFKYESHGAAEDKGALDVENAIAIDIVALLREVQYYA